MNRTTAAALDFSRELRESGPKPFECIGTAEFADILPLISAALADARSDKSMNDYERRKIADAIEAVEALERTTNEAGGVQRGRRYRMA